MEIKPNNIYCGNSYELIKNIPDKSIDLVYVDIPYDYTNGGKGGGFLKSEARKKTYIDTIGKFDKGIDWSILDEFCRVLKHIYIWCNDKQIADYLDFFVREHNCDYKILGFHKTNPMPSYHKRFMDDIEYCLFFVEKGKQKFYGTDTYNNSFKIYSSPINTYDKDKYEHASIKPYQCVKNHLEKTCKSGMVVLDSFCGSGTVPKVCQELGLNFIAFEIDKKWWQVANDRLNGIDTNGNVNLFDL